MKDKSDCLFCYFMTQWHIVEFYCFLEFHKQQLSQTFKLISTAWFGGGGFSLSLPSPKTLLRALICLGVHCSLWRLPVYHSQSVLSNILMLLLDFVKMASWNASCRGQVQSEHHIAWQSFCFCCTLIYYTSVGETLLLMISVSFYLFSSLIFTTLNFLAVISKWHKTIIWSYVERSVLIWLLNEMVFMWYLWVFVNMHHGLASTRDTKSSILEFMVQ